MLSEELIEFIHSGPWIYIGSCNKKLKSHITMGYGAFADRIKNEITVFVHKKEAEMLLSNLEHNKKLAVTMGLPTTHTAYQFKGVTTLICKTTEEQYAIQEIYKKKLIDLMLKEGLPEKILNSLNLKCSVALTFNIQDIFVSTPGPDAGAKIENEKE